MGVGLNNLLFRLKPGFHRVFSFFKKHIDTEIVSCYYLLIMKKFVYKQIDKTDKFRFVGKGNWKDCLEFIVNEFNVYRQWVMKQSEHLGKKMNHFDVRILFLEKRV